MPDIRVRFSKGSEDWGPGEEVEIQVPARYCTLAGPFDDVATIRMPLLVAEWLAKLLRITVTDKIDANAFVDF